jgi:hypothetical protein
MLKWLYFAAIDCQYEVLPMNKKSRKKQNAIHVDLGARNAFRLIKRAAKLCGDEVRGNIYHLPITITYIDEPPLPPEQLTSHEEVIDRAVQILGALGFSLETALDTIYSAQETKKVMRGMYSKV